MRLRSSLAQMRAQMGTLSVDQQLAYIDAAKAQGHWYPACNGTETPFTSRSGKRLLYVFQPTTGKHAYLDLGTDLILSPEEATAALGTV